jgi:hypothetical protein
MRAVMFAALVLLVFLSGIANAFSGQTKSSDDSRGQSDGSQEVLGANWHQSNVRPNRTWSTESFDAEVALYKLLRSHNILNEGEPARAVLSPFIGVMDGPFNTPTVTYWDGQDLIAAAPQLRDIVAQALAAALAGQSESWSFETDIVLLEIERSGRWICGVGKGCYPEGLIITTRPMEISEADALCRRLHEMDKVCTVVKN